MPEFNAASFGDAIRRTRKVAGYWSVGSLVKAMQDAVGYSTTRPTVESYELGRRVPSFEFVCAFACTCSPAKPEAVMGYLMKAAYASDGE